MEKKTKYQLAKTGLWGEVVRQKKPIIVNDYELPNKLKKGYPEGRIRLAKFMSIPIIIDGHIVAVAGFANKEEDYDENDIYQVTALMNGVWYAKERRERTQELVEINRSLKSSKKSFNLSWILPLREYMGLTIENAENMMYVEKTLERKKFNEAFIKTGMPLSSCLPNRKFYNFFYHEKDF
ncbi:MAG TPA: GAF domain-containing protein [Peptococcaceae bacterium]|nr:GAF domain-containing protein [Peptococcaceae bacterium]